MLLSAGVVMLVFLQRMLLQMSEHYFATGTLGISNHLNPGSYDLKLLHNNAMQN
jgi:hypothetical protein